jgi:hypothetical protein
MEKLAQNNVIVALDPQLPPLEVNHKALKDIFNLTRYCLAPVGQDRPNISTCLSTLIKIKESYEQAAQRFPQTFLLPQEEIEKEREKLLSSTISLYSCPSAF